MVSKKTESKEWRALLKDDAATIAFVIRIRIRSNPAKRDQKRDGKFGGAASR
jgi:hypothetical protein